MPLRKNSEKNFEKTTPSEKKTLEKQTFEKNLQQKMLRKRNNPFGKKKTTPLKK